MYNLYVLFQLCGFNFTQIKVIQVVCFRLKARNIFCFLIFEKLFTVLLEK